MLRRLWAWLFRHRHKWAYAETFRGDQYHWQGGYESLHGQVCECGARRITFGGGRIADPYSSAWPLAHAWVRGKSPQPITPPADAGGRER